MRSSMYKHTAANDAIAAASVKKQFPTLLQDVKGPQRKPRKVMIGVCTLTIAAPSPCTSPDQEARLTATARTK